MDKLKEMIDKVVDKVKKDPDFAKKFQKEPVKALEDILGVDLPDDKVNSIIDAVKTKIKLDKINAEKRQVAIKQYSKNGDFIKTWKSARACQNETGYFDSRFLQRNLVCGGILSAGQGSNGKAFA